MAMDGAVCGGRGTLAWGAPCAIDEDTKRPTVGQVNLCTKIVGDKTNTTIDTFKHEVMHVISMHPYLFGYPSVGLIEETIPWKVTNNRSSTRNITYFATNYPNTVEAVRSHFGCPSLKGIRLDPQGRHWDKLFLGNELMTPSVDLEQQFSNITATFLSEFRYNTTDRPFYQVNFAHIEEDISKYWYGKGLGCTFAMESCRAYVDEIMINFDTNNDLLTPAFPFCAPSNVLDENVTICCGEKQIEVRTKCEFVKKDLNEYLLDTGFQNISRNEWTSEYGYYEDTKAAGYYGIFFVNDFCPVIDFEEVVSPSDCMGAFHSCRAAVVVEAGEGVMIPLAHLKQSCSPFHWRPHAIESENDSFILCLCDLVPGCLNVRLQ